MTHCLLMNYFTGGITLAVIPPVFYHLEGISERNCAVLPMLHHEELDP